MIMYVKISHDQFGIARIGKHPNLGFTCLCTEVPGAANEEHILLWQIFVDVRRYLHTANVVRVVKHVRQQTLEEAGTATDAKHRDGWAIRQEVGQGVEQGLRDGHTAIRMMSRLSRRSKTHSGHDVGRAIYESRRRLALMWLVLQEKDETLGCQDGDGCARAGRPVGH